MIEIFSILHSSNLVYNDLKPAHIRINHTGKITLIDFGLTSRVVTRKTRVGKFNGNLVYSSFPQMDFYATQPRDDLVSLYYMMVSMLNNFHLPGLCSIKGQRDEIE